MKETEHMTNTYTEATNNGWLWKSRKSEWSASLIIGEIENDESPYEYHTMKQGTFTHNGTDCEIGFCSMRGYYIEAVANDGDKILSQPVWELLQEAFESATKAGWFKCVEKETA